MSRVTHKEKTRQVLEKAKARLKKGWRKNTFGPYHMPTGQVCAVGALRSAFFDDEDTDLYTVVYDNPIYKDALNILSKCVPQGFRDVAAYNDDIKTKKSDVLKLYDCAIEKVEV